MKKKTEEKMRKSKTIGEDNKFDEQRFKCGEYKT